MEEGQPRGFRMSVRAHVAFVIFYIAILLSVTGYGTYYFLSHMPHWQLSRTTTPPVTTINGRVIKPAPGAHIVIYPAMEQRLNHQGDVIVALTLNPDGSVLDATIATSSGWPALDAAALQSVRSWRYPPLGNGAPATRKVKIAYRLSG